MYKFLQAEFEREIVPLIENDVVKVGRFAFTCAEILGLAGERSYKDAFGDWFWDEWVPVRRERKNDLLKIGSNEARFDELKRIIAHGAATPFVGSGMSVPTGMPTWDNFLRQACRKANGFTLKELDAILKSGDYEAAASRIFASMPPQLFGEIFERNFTTKGSMPIGGPVRLLPYIFDALVITTNFDGILEEVYKQADKSFRESFYGMDIRDFRRKSVVGSRNLLKLHGNHSATHGRVLLKDEYNGFYNPQCNGREELTLIFRRGGLVFLGCSLMMDRTMTLLKEIADSDRNMPSHYALLQCPKKPKQITEREHFLAERNIFPIWYDGEHNEDIEALLVGLMEDLKKL